MGPRTGAPLRRSGGGPVLVGYDGTDQARHAVLWAAREARRRGAVLTVLYAADWPGMAPQPGQALEPGALDAADEVAAAGVDLARSAQPGIPVEGRTSTDDPVRALLAAGAGAALVVVGTRGRGPMARTLLGSVSRKVAARCPLPVVVVPQGAAETEVSASLPVLVGTDGSPAARSAVAFAADWAAAAGTALHLRTCRDDAVGPDLAEEILASACRDLAGSHPDLEIRACTCAGPPAAALVGESARSGLLVVGTRGRTGVAELLIGSVAAEVVRASSCPVAVITP